MTIHNAYIGIGANLGDPSANVERALVALEEFGAIVRRSTLYRTRPWGKTDQPDFVNAAALLETSLAPRELLSALKTVERGLGREPGERWGPRIVDLDLLAYDALEIDEPNLRIPHPHLRERAFVLVPLAEIDPGFADARDALPAEELQGVEPLNRGTVTGMAAQRTHVTARVRRLAEFLAAGDAVRVRVESPDGEFEVARTVRGAATQHVATATATDARAMRIETIKADLVGIFRLSRPAPTEGEVLDEDRELAYIEALGIRTPVRSLGTGRVVAIASVDGAPVEYGQPLFLLDRG